MVFFQPSDCTFCNDAGLARLCSMEYGNHIASLCSL
jgi:hypothetical protein